MAFVFIIRSLTLGAQDITGKWYGYPDLKNMRLRLEYHVEKAGGGYQVTLKIPDLSEKTYRADAVELADHVLTVNIADAQTRSILRLQADGSLKGTFLWEGYDFELLLTRTPGGVQASADSERAFFLSFGRGDFSECG